MVGTYFMALQHGPPLTTAVMTANKNDKMEWLKHCSNHWQSKQSCEISWQTVNNVKWVYGRAASEKSRHLFHPLPNTDILFHKPNAGLVPIKDSLLSSVVPYLFVEKEKELFQTLMKKTNSLMAKTTGQFPVIPAQCRLFFLEDSIPQHPP